MCDVFATTEQLKLCEGGISGRALRSNESSTSGRLVPTAAMSLPADTRKRRQLTEEELEARRVKVYTSNNKYVLDWQWLL